MRSRLHQRTNRATGMHAAIVAAVALAALSLLAPWGPIYDSWSWLVWGRELATLELDTSAGPSWKPLPVLVTAALSPLGDVAPELWLALARAGWIMAVILVGLLAFRLGGGGKRGALAGALAAAGMVLLADDVTSWTRQGTGGLTEPLLVALCVGAVLAALERRVGAALVLAALACLIRVEAWPFAAAYAWRELRAGRASPLACGAGALAILALWFVPDLLAAGDALEGAGRARGGLDLGEGVAVIGRALALPLAALWAGAAIFAIRAGRGDWRILGIGALAWIALVAVMTVVGFAGLPRFMAPAAAIVCALGGAGIACALTAGPTWRVVATLALVAFGIQGSLRVAEIPDEIERAADEHRSLAPLLEAVRSDPSLLACVPRSTADFRAQPPLAWELDLALGDIIPTTSAYTPRGALVIGPRALPELAARARAEGTLVADAGEWEVYAFAGCAGARR